MQTGGDLRTLGLAPVLLAQRVTSEKERADSEEVTPRVAGDAPGWCGLQWAAKGHGGIGPEMEPGGVGGRSPGLDGGRKACLPVC